MKNTVVMASMMVALTCSCEYKKFIDGVRQDAEQSSVARKAFFRILAFNGKIYLKKYCDYCETNKYQLVINIIHKNPALISLSDSDYQPYYSFQPNNQLVISVEKHIYDSIQENEPIDKEANSCDIWVKGIKYQLVSYCKK